MTRRASGATELKVADVLAEREAWDEGSGIETDSLWALVQPQLPRGDAARAYADDRRYRKHAEAMTQAERTAAGQRMFFDDAVAVMVKDGQLATASDGKMWLGKEPLWRKAGEKSPLEIYVPGTRALRDAEAQQRIDDRKLLKRALARKAFQVSPESPNYKDLMWSMRRYGFRGREYPILVDADEPSFVLVGRTRLAVAQALESERPGITQQVVSSAIPVKADGRQALRELFRADVFRRQLSSKDIGELKELLAESDIKLEEVEQVEALVRQREDVVQRNHAEVRARIKQELIADASRSNVQIAETVGTSDPTVGTVRAELLKFRSIHAYLFKGGQSIRAGEHSEKCWCGEGQAVPAPPKSPSPERRQARELLQQNPTQSNAQIRDQVGLNPNQHRIVEDERRKLENEGKIPQVTAREGKDGTVRRTPSCSHCPVHCPDE